MLGYTKNDVPFQSKINYKMIRWLRLSKNKNQEQFGAVCHIDQSVLARIETGAIDLTISYESRILEGCKKLAISDQTIQAIKELTQQIK